MVAVAKPKKPLPRAEVHAIYGDSFFVNGCFFKPKKIDLRTAQRNYETQKIIAEVSKENEGKPEYSPLNGHHPDK